MGERTGSTLVRILVVALSLTAFSFAIAAERRRSTGSIHPDPATNTTYCVYDSDVATGYGVGAFLFLLSSQSLIMGVTKCMCFGQPLAPGGNRARCIIYFTSSWLAFLIADACLLAGATENAYHTKYRHVVHAQNWTCESLRKGVFIAGAVFVFFTMILNVYYYMFFTKTTSHLVAGKTTRSSSTSTVGMTGYS
ncbi:Modifying wall lignin-1/2 protein [Dioscorea alata]|uniref:Modifying wall lignin-1/2 protein n=1 Tax=Dioscorea alata TaxID=55571 RepID=A0ACB7W4J2_DIOAL|nr:Modifying wall lignin-1/2 protein [Dioscorea alata]